MEWTLESIYAAEKDMYNAGSVMHLRLTCDEIRSTTEVLVATSWSRATLVK